ncbi:hypothetical protein [Limosilactobacillus reuteri]|nr:hypothetical protein [Limosilactobacillus reuteri]
MRYVYSQICVSQLGLLNDRVESKKAGNRKLVDGGRNHNPR